MEGGGKGKGREVNEEIWYYGMDRGCGSRGRWEEKGKGGKERRVGSQLDPRTFKPKLRHCVQIKSYSSLWLNVKPIDNQATQL